MFSEYPDMVNVKQLRQMLGISRAVAYDLLSKKLVKGIKVANAYRIPKISIIDFIFEGSGLEE
jgi:predicted DNA-binding transcriptional regulator AlpA